MLFTWAKLPTLAFRCHICGAGRNKERHFEKFITFWIHINTAAPTEIVHVAQSNDFANHFGAFIF